MQSGEVWVYNKRAVLKCFAATASKTELLGFIFESFAGYGLQKSKFEFQIKKTIQLV